VETRVVRRLSEIAAADWDAIAGDDDPFVEHAFLSLLEESRSVGRGTGWDPRHITLWDGHTLIGALPAYLKDDSWGEFVFDFQWARAAQMARIRYYPKVVAMVPYTPATGTRFLIAKGRERGAIVEALLEGLRAMAIDEGASSVHVNYLDARESQEAIALGWPKPRLSVQFHFHNLDTHGEQATGKPYASFDAFLERFRSSARKQVRRERRDVLGSGVEVRTMGGAELSPRDWKALDTFYRMNVARHGSYAYLTPAFFAAMPERLAHRVVASLAYKNGEPIGGTLNFEKGAVLYGRYWGCVDDAPFLHFECCYYQLIERTIARGMARFEAGAQGHHKIKRGLVPSEVHSVHWMKDPRLAQAVESFLPEEMAAMRYELDALSGETPFKRGSGD
jgi:predicted N-acyltransferase